MIRCLQDGQRVMQRNPALELYRILLMFLIVVHHAAAHGLWANDVVHHTIPLLFTLAIFWHVDGFLAITGWFGTHFSLCKFLRLWGVIVFYSVVDFVYTYLTTGHVSIRMAGGWFGKLYLFFLFMVPLLNAALSYFKMVDRRLMLVAWMIFDVALFLDWCPTHFLSCVYTGWNGMSLLPFIAIYINVGFLRISGLADSFKLRHFGMAVCLYIVLCLIGSAHSVWVVLRGGGGSSFELAGLDILQGPSCVYYGNRRALVLQNVC